MPGEEECRETVAINLSPFIFTVSQASGASDVLQKFSTLETLLPNFVNP